MRTKTPEPDLPPYLVLAFGVAAVSSAALLIRLASEAPPLVIAAGRMLVASLVIVPLTLIVDRPGLGVPQRSQWLWMGLGGLFLAGHFAFWIASLALTSVASSVVIVTSNPVFVALGSALLGLDRLTPRIWLGIGLAVLGGAVIGGSHLGPAPAFATGDILALIGSLFVAGYYLVGRSVRQQVPLLPYLAVVYGSAAALLLATLVLTDHSPFGYSLLVYLLLLLLGLVPQVLGHSALNWALGYLPAVSVTMAVMGEPVGASLLAWLVLAEPPTWAEAAGGVLILAGVYLVSRPGAAGLAPRPRPHRASLTGQTG